MEYMQSAQTWESGKPGLPKGSAGWVRTQLKSSWVVTQRVHRRILYTKPKKNRLPDRTQEI